MRPSSLICKQWICDYCQRPAYEEKWATSYQYGIIACLDHRDCAQRDIRAFYHRREEVLVEDVLEFSPELARVQKNITWADDTGAQKQGGVICRSAPIRCSFVSSFRGQMAIPLDVGGGIVRPFHVKDLINTDGIKWDSLDRLLEKLREGFYKEEYEAHLSALPIVSASVVVPVVKTEPLSAPVETKEQMLERLTRVEPVYRKKKTKSKITTVETEDGAVGQSQTEGSDGDDDGGIWTVVK